MLHYSIKYLTEDIAMNRLFSQFRLIVFFLGVTSTSILAAATVEIADFGSNPGNLRMFRYLPSTLQPSTPLVIALHGCKQTASDYGDQTGWIQFADRWGFVLLLPQQQQTNNHWSCFNWFRPGDSSRDQGEALSIQQMIDRMKADYPIDPDRIYITGLSAGGAMAAVMLATYPEVFASGAIIAGIPYRCASGLWSALRCMLWGRDLNPLGDCLTCHLSI